MTSTGRQAAATERGQTWGGARVSPPEPGLVREARARAPGQGFDVAQVDADGLLEYIEMLRAKDLAAKLLDDD